ncbi:MAG: FHA domain-containing protein, partial [Candidatus Parcubacteria bacterium]|nr:FHA domain-containing protein [Leptolyngbyaceae cyanobacterium LF-bin-113]
SIGRHRTSSVKISDVRASKFHAALIQADNGYLIVDRGSHNGTFVDGEKIKSQLLKGNEEIRIGTTMCYFRLGIPEYMTTAFGTISG